MEKSEHAVTPTKEDLGPNASYGLIEPEESMVSDEPASYGLIEETEEVAAPKSPPVVKAAAPAQPIQDDRTQDSWGTNDDKELDERYLIFRLNNEAYATPILTVREVVEMQVTKPLPSTPDYFVGVTNLRGQILSIIDLRKLFGIAEQKHVRNSLIVVDTPNGPVGCVVDFVESVSVITHEVIDRKTRVECKIPLEHFTGFGKVDDQVITIFNLQESMKAVPLFRVA